MNNTRLTRRPRCCGRMSSLSWASSGFVNHCARHCYFAYPNFLQRLSLFDLGPPYHSVQLDQCHTVFEPSLDRSGQCICPLCDHLLWFALIIRCFSDPHTLPGIFAYYLLWATLKGNVRFGLQIPFIMKIHPMEFRLSFSLFPFACRLTD